MTEYTLSVVQLCPDLYKDAANAVAEAAGFGPNNLSVKLVKADNSIWWGCHAWWMPSVFEAQMSSTDPQVVEVLSHVITSVREGGEPVVHWMEALSANGLTVFVDEGEV